MKLIKTEVNYILEDDKGVVIASTSLKKEGLELSTKNCQAIERGYDLGEIKRKVFSGFDGYPNSFTMAAVERTIEVMMELMGDKKYSEGDMLECWNSALKISNFWSEFMDSLQQTEWDVEIEMEKVKDETKIVGAVKGVKGSGSKITTYKSVPKLNADGCLILKRI